MNDRLGELLSENDVLFGIICRDATSTDLELMAQTGYRIVWIDLEHGPQSTAEAIRLGRLAKHLGLVPLVRIVELTRTEVQRLLDGGFQIVTLPDVRSPSAAARLVELGKYPPMGRRGVSTTSAGTDFSLGPDPRRTMIDANEATHLMVQFESNEAYERRDEIIATEGIDMVTLGPSDWGADLGLFGSEARSHLAPKIEGILASASAAGKTACVSVSSPEEARLYYGLGVRIFFAGVDIALKRSVLTQNLASFRAAVDELR